MKCNQQEVVVGLSVVISIIFIDFILASVSHNLENQIEIHNHQIPLPQLRNRAQNCGGCISIMASDQGHCIVLLGKTFHSHSAFL